MGPEDIHLLVGQEAGVWALACPDGMCSNGVSCREKGLPEEMKFDLCLQDKVAGSSGEGTGWPQQRVQHVQRQSWNPCSRIIGSWI